MKKQATMHEIRMIAYLLGLFIGMTAAASPEGSRTGKPVHLDPLIRVWIEKSRPHPVSRLIDGEASGPAKMRVLITLHEDSPAEELGISVRARIGDICTADLSLDELKELIRLRSVKAVAFPRRCYPALDRSIPEIQVERVWAGDGVSPGRGQGTVVGIYDSGIDWTHPDFIDAGGKSRILRVWDQTDEQGDPPEGFGYGTEYGQDEIQAALDANGAEDLSLRDLTGHGTHVAGIAAGNGRATGNGIPPCSYVGTAPEAPLIMVKGGDDYFTTDRILEGLLYIFQKAGEWDAFAPVVINLSAGGTHWGPHDGTSVFERGIDNLLSEPGRAIVIAAGNEGDDPIHFRGEFQGAATLDSLIVGIEIPVNSSALEDYAALDIWYPSYSNIAVTVLSPGGMRLGPVSSGSLEEMDTPEGHVLVSNAYLGSDPENNDKELQIWLSDTHGESDHQDNLSAGEWRIVLHARPGRVDGWLFESSMGAYLTGPVDYTTLLAEPANCRLGISVGSYISRDQWPSLWMNPWGPGGMTVGEISSFSSPGPTRPNSKGSNPFGKPDITAPGEYILSSLSSQMDNPPADHFWVSDSMHRALRGTSMAAPHVTGVVALMLEREPQLLPAEIRGRLILSARKDAFTGNEWNRYWGYGKLDGYAAVAGTPVSIREDPVSGIDARMPAVFPNPFNHSTRISVDLNHSAARDPSLDLTIYALDGRKIRTLVKGPVPAGRLHAVWDGRDDRGRLLPTGMYFCYLRYSGVRQTAKISLIR